MFGGNAYGAIGYAGIGPYHVLEPSRIIFRINGTTDARVRYPALSIHDVLGAQPNTGSLTFLDTEPAVGAAIQIGYGSLRPVDLLFAGQVQHFARTYESRPLPALTSWPADLIDYCFTLNKRRPFGAYTNVSATTVAQQVVAAYAPGFTTVNVVAGLPAISINFDGSEPLLEALNRVATLVGARCKVDYARDVHIYIDESSISDPTPITLTNPPLNTPPITFDIDLSQVRTRVYGKGHGESVAVDMPAGNQFYGTLPVENQVMFHQNINERASAIIAQSAEAAQTDLINYYGVSRDQGHATTVRGLPQSPGTPSGTPLIESGNLQAGSYQYRQTYVIGQDESEASAASGVVTISAVSAPATASAASQASGAGNLDAGTYLYCATFKTSNGETLNGPGWSGTIAATTAPGSGPNLTPVSGAMGNLKPATYSYTVTFETSRGETTGGPASSGTISSVGAPGDCSKTPTTGGAMAVGSYWYAITFVTGAGETSNPITGSAVILGTGQNAVNLTFIPTSGDARVTGRRIYRTTVSSPNYNNRNYYFLVGNLNDNTTTTFLDTKADASLGAVTVPPTSTASGGQMNISAIPTSGDARVTKRNVYRTPSTGGTARLARTLSDNTTTSFTDNLADENLGVTVPTTNTAIGGQMNVTSLPISGDARVTGRRIYRSLVNGAGDYLLVKTLSDNTTTSFVDNTPDSGLGEQRPAASTATNGKIAVSNIAIGPAGTTARRLYRTPVNGGAFRLVGSVGDNSTTTFTDNVADSSLGREVPTASAVHTPAGSTSLSVDDCAPFSEGWGWVAVGNQLVYFYGRSVASGPGVLQNIPASGTGSLIAAAPAGTPVIGYGFLRWINDGTGLAQPVAKGSAVHIWIQRDDPAAQDALGQLERNPDGTPTDGIREYLVSDERRGETSLIELCDAELARFAHPIVSVAYATRDRQTRAGAIVHIDLGWGFTGDYLIQDVTITIDPAPSVAPRYSVRGSSAKFTFADLLQRVILEHP
jgi:hypothetical protein